MQQRDGRGEKLELIGKTPQANSHRNELAETPEMISETPESLGTLSTDNNEAPSRFT